MLLLQHDACASVINGNAEIPKDVTESAEIKSMLEGKHSCWTISVISLNLGFLQPTVFVVSAL